MAGPTGFEPATSGLTVQCANQAAPRARTRINDLDLGSVPRHPGAIGGIGVAGRKAGMKPRTNREDAGLVTRVGSLEIDWPRSIGYFGGIGIAVACELIAPPIAIFIAAIPLLKLFKHPGRPWPLRVVADALEGAAKPVGADAEAVVRLVPGVPAKRHRSTKARRSGNDRPSSRAA